VGGIVDCDCAAGGVIAVRTCPEAFRLSTPALIETERAHHGISCRGEQRSQQRATHRSAVADVARPDSGEQLTSRCDAAAAAAAADVDADVVYYHPQSAIAVIAASPRFSIVITQCCRM